MTKFEIMGCEPLILSVETSSRIGSVAIAFGEKTIDEAVFSGPMRHSAEIFPAITTLLGAHKLKSEQIKQIYISIGPGSFTGLRIAVTIAKSLNLANSTKIVTVDTLDVIAANIEDYLLENSGGKGSAGKFAAILDAKRGKFFMAVYDCSRKTQDGNFKKIMPSSLLSSHEFLSRYTKDKICLLGDGLLYQRDEFEAENTSFAEQKYWSPRAGKVHKLGWQKAWRGDFADPMALVPFYLCKPDIKVKHN